MSDSNEAVATDVAPPVRAQSTLIEQAMRYLVVGGIAFAIDYSTLVVLKEMAGVNYMAAAAVAFACGLVANYILSIRWVFTSRSLERRWLEFFVFVLIGLLGLGVNELLMFVGTGELGLDYRISKLLSVAVILCWNFGARKILLFRDRG